MKLKSSLRRILPHFVWSFISRIGYSLSAFWGKARWRLFGRKANWFEVPIIINNYNRLEYLLRLIASLESRGYHNIHILDNKSNYQPLLKYYETCPYEVLHLSKNFGFPALWKSGVYERFKSSFYVYTDSDMEIDDDCPADFMNRFGSLLLKYPFCSKVGFGIRIDNLPECFNLRDQVREHEAQFWEKEVEPGVFKAVIDTTFALYPPYTEGASSPYKTMFRLGSPYVIRHLPWYVDSSNLSEEDKYYLSTIAASTSHWSARAKETEL